MGDQRELKKIIVLDFMIHETCDLGDGQRTEGDSPSRSVKFARLPPRLSDAISAEVTLGRGPAITRNKLSFAAFEKKKKIANVAKNGCGRTSEARHL